MTFILLRYCILISLLLINSALVFSNDTNVSSLFKFWNLKESFRFQRLFKKL